LTREAATVDVHETVASFRDALDRERAASARIGLVPTMGYLHDGHLSLMREAAARSEVVAVTIFVNPLQFGANEDLADYPRDLPRDLGLCEALGVKHVFTPSTAEMYPEPAVTTVTVDALARAMEGKARPTHFAGVTTVVAKLFNIAGRCAAFFGEKDFQQLAIVRRMVRDLDFPVQVVGCPIVRELDGVAMSSRNVYLTPPERQAAPVLHRAVQAGAAAILAGERDATAVRRLMGDIIDAEPLAQRDYAEVVDAASLTPSVALVGGDELRLLVAAKLGVPRLLDNLGVRVPDDGSE
jgi:pantoate--beta-alanine ligase